MRMKLGFCLVLFLSLSLSSISQVCELIAGESVNIEFANFAITKVTDNGTDCTLDYTVDYRVINPDGCGVNFQSVILTGSGSQTTFVINTDMNWHTSTGKIFNTACNGNADIRISGGWGHPCTYKGISWPGVTCQSVYYEKTILPVELVDFQAKSIGSSVELNWSTATEEDNEMFIVEHSVDGSNFNELTEIQGAGNSTITQFYSFFHENPAKGNNYYRLKQIDFDGDYEYSDIKSVWIEGYSNILVYPNPTIDKISFKSDIELEINTYEIYNQFGKVVQGGQNILSNESIMMSSEIPNGTYFMRLETDRGIFVRRILYMNTK